MIEKPTGLRTVCWDLPDDLAMISGARHKVMKTLISWGIQDFADDVVLVVAELLANAVTYGEPPIRLSLWAGTQDLYVRVSDHGPQQPRRLALDVEAVHGRGLAIVAILAEDHGVTRPPDGPGKTVWARWRFTAHNAEAAHLATAESISRPDTPASPILSRPDDTDAP
ncbi:ATP-binding protein [Sphaerisporangium sp. NPDC051011]|uniref:ATP-binding protein n=1 Tax=Sphaerisporangium sp. NPDC051011 TaxID=3155792 RepID=UPI0033C57620